MLTICLMILSFGYDTFLFMLFYLKTLQPRYSIKTTIWGTIFCWIGFSFLKVPIFFSIGMKYTGVLNVIIMIILCIYQKLLFQGTPAKRVLSMVLFAVYMYFMELVAVRVANLIVGENRLMDLESNFTLISLIIIDILLAFGYYPLLCLWNLLLKISWNSTSGRRQWLCVILPLSQYFLMEYLAITYNIRQEVIPGLSIWGFLLGVLADFYMFILFYRDNRKRKAEEALQQEQKLYEREQLYYEHLQESQKEIAGIRHDYQNYILVLRNLSQKKHMEGHAG